MIYDFLLLLGAGLELLVAGNYQMFTPSFSLYIALTSAYRLIALENIVPTTSSRRAQGKHQ